MRKSILYYFSILLSIIFIAVPFLIGIHVLTEDARLITRFATGNTVISDWLQIIIAILCVLAYKFVSNWRQELRDEVEYDEHGISKRYGYFSKLSSEERKKIEEQKMIDAERILDSATMKRITHKGEPDPEKAMEKLVGLNNVKKDMHEMAARMAYEKETRKGKNKKNAGPVSSMNMIFMGPPGTGKTTVARIMAGFLYRNGYIKKNQCVEVDGNFLNGMSPGESSKKTQMLITKSLGGVLFIDEAYALLQSKGTGYGQEAIATIVKAMEDHKNEIVFILAGYDKEMKEFVNSNPGIESRIKKYMWFGDYTVQDLQNIFMFMAGQQNFCVSAGIMEVFGERMRHEMKQPNFGNARTVRNLLDKIIDRHALNMMEGVLDQSKRYILEEIDMPEIEHQFV